jgi:predicted RNA-binding protein with PIN domain
VSVLIDGYNLLHAVGYAPPPNCTRTAHDSARRRFLDWLTGTPAVKADPSVIRVVFDALNSKRDFGNTTHRGVTVTFSFGQTADDLIEALISVFPNPHLLRVVSNDSRLRDFARRKKCQHLSCEEFLDWLTTPPTSRPDDSPKPDDKPRSDWPDEFDTLMKAFG